MNKKFIVLIALFFIIGIVGAVSVSSVFSQKQIDRLSDSQIKTQTKVFYKSYKINSLGIEFNFSYNSLKKQKNNYAIESKNYKITFPKEIVLDFIAREGKTKTIQFMKRVLIQQAKNKKEIELRKIKKWKTNNSILNTNDFKNIISTTELN